MGLAHTQRLLRYIEQLPSCPETFEIDHHPVDTGFLVIADGRLVPYHARTREEADEVVTLIRRLVAAR